MTMSSDDSKRNSSQARQEKSKQDTSAQAQNPQSTDTPRPLPFDETGDEEKVMEPGSTRTPIDPDI
jgi:hypothetical protein